MNTNENARTSATEEVIELGVASVETKGPAGINEFVGNLMQPGISEE